MSPIISFSGELRQESLFWLTEPDAARKSEGVGQLAQQWREGRFSLDSARKLPSSDVIPGRPPKPELVPAKAVARRAMHTVEGRAAMIHALAHIEFNAINLALDAIWRFPAMPDAYYVDWLQVAAEESLHFNLLATHLANMGYAYGDFSAHDGLWEMADKTRGDVLARLALIPRTMEARGLDVSPAIRDKFLQAGDHDAAAILDIILRDEIGHVRIGNHWYGWVCEQRSLEPGRAYSKLMADYQLLAPRGPFNLEARRAAGFTDTELAELMRASVSA